MNAAKASYQPSTGTYALHVDLGGRTWRVGSVNATNIRQGGMTIKGGTLYGATAGKVVLDLTGANRLTLEHVSIRGDNANPPAIGLLLSRSAEYNYAIAPQHRIIGLATFRKFSKAAVVNFASEVISWTNCHILNEHRSTSAYAMVITGNAATLDEYLGGVSSEHATVPTAATGSHSCILHDLGYIKILRRADVNLEMVSVSKSNPAVVTVDPTALAASGLVSGDQVFFQGVEGMTQLNGNFYTIANLNAAAGTFELSG